MYDKQLANVSHRFIPELHVESSVDQALHRMFGDAIFVRRLEATLDQTEAALRSVPSKLPVAGRWPAWDVKRILFLNHLTVAVESATQAIAAARHTLLDVGRGRFAEISPQMIEALGTLDGAIEAYEEGHAQLKAELVSSVPKDEAQIKWAHYVLDEIPKSWRPLGSLLSDLNDVKRELEDCQQRQLHVFGRAGMGKTHLAAHLVGERVEAELPAILLLGGDLSKGQSLEASAREALDIPASRSWNDFVQALDAAAEAYRVRLPIVIDGLNESEDIHSLSRGIRGYVTTILATRYLVICTTCRDEYREPIWELTPPNAQYLRGFPTDELAVTIQRYFAWYRLKADTTLVSLDHFAHPILLRIFCEASNPERQQEKEVHVGEQTLFAVFDAYVDRLNKTICSRLDKDPSLKLVHRKLERFAEGLWQQNVRRLEYVKGKSLMDEADPTAWKEAFTRNLLDEGVLQRSWWKGTESIGFSYDLMAGYTIAKWLLFGPDTQAARLNLDSALMTTRLLSEVRTDLHPLSDDILSAICIFCPARFSEHLPDILKIQNARAFSFSVQALFEMEPRYVDERQKQVVINAFRASVNRPTLLAIARPVWFNSAHPLNFRFWSEQLANLSMPDRDLSWSEYLRRNKDSVVKDLNEIEQLCRRARELTELQNARLQLAAECLMWTLTSTVRPLRDQATRALVRFGRAFPAELLAMAERSLAMNDPYVPERMVAALYGVAMGSRSAAEFCTTELRQIGSKLYKAFFASKAPHATTHLLLRDYARRAVELASLHNPGLLSAASRRRIEPPFKSGGIRKWGQSEDLDRGSYREGSGPLHMDFENYTLGTLVRDRANYDYSNPDYQRVRRMFFWRLYRLGYNHELFKDVDTEIVRFDNYRFGRSADGEKTDRYGKKYSWIAYYELAGYRSDRGLVGHHFSDEIRPADADIDPSFPQARAGAGPIGIDLLGNRNTSVGVWIRRGSVPSLRPFLLLDEVSGLEGPWVLLDAYIRQEDPSAKRALFLFVRTVCAAKSHFERFLEFMRKQDLKGRWLPEIPQDYYTFGGEIPWCETFPRNGKTDFEFVVGSKRRTVSQPTFEQQRSGPTLKFALVTRHNTLDVPVMKRFKAFIPVRENSWESYHSSLNPSQHGVVPARELAEGANLVVRPESLELVQPNGEHATLMVESGEAFRARQSLLYIKRDLLEEFLKVSRQRMLWATWGEREFYYGSDLGELEALRNKQVSFFPFQELATYDEVRGT
jgi:hypothetical protein